MQKLEHEIIIKNLQSSLVVLTVIPSDKETLTNVKVVGPLEPSNYKRTMIYEKNLHTLKIQKKTINNPKYLTDDSLRTTGRLSTATGSGEVATLTDSTSG